MASILIALTVVDAGTDARIPPLCPQFAKNLDKRNGMGVHNPHTNAVLSGEMDPDIQIEHLLREDAVYPQESPSADPDGRRRRSRTKACLITTPLLFHHLGTTLPP